MTSAERILAYLQDHEKGYVSGAVLADLLGISRAAVWKAVERLRDEGHVVEAVTNRGYRLVMASTLLDKEHLAPLLADRPLYLFDIVDSTNRFAKHLAAEGAADGTTVVSLAQSKGRGRLGRYFSSPRGGVYLSVVFRPSCGISDAMLVTSAASVAVARAISSVCGMDVSIKWVNDLFLHGRKVCGILSEGVLDMENGGLSVIIVGIGINYCTPELAFPSQLLPVATSLFDGEDAVPEGVDAAHLVAAIVENLSTLVAHLPDRSFLAEYRNRSMLLGRTVSVHLGKTVREAVAESIDDDAHLHVRYLDGTRASLGTGEVSIRLEA